MLASVVLKVAQLRLLCFASEVVSKRRPPCTGSGSPLSSGCALAGMQVRRPGDMLEFEVWDGRLFREFQVTGIFHLPCMRFDEAAPQHNKVRQPVHCCPLMLHRGERQGEGDAASQVNMGTPATRHSHIGVQKRNPNDLAFLSGPFQCSRVSPARSAERFWQAGVGRVELLYFSSSPMPCRGDASFCWRTCLTTGTSWASGL